MKHNSLNVCNVIKYVFYCNISKPFAIYIHVSRFMYINLMYTLCIYLRENSTYIKEEDKYNSDKNFVIVKSVSQIKS